MGPYSLRTVAHFYPTGKTVKPTACFARRVKRTAQKYLSFRNTEDMG
jgi:hypothetical protein